ncbi:unnamed protein product, partial [Vitis vinifera]|uniref:Uncharacterized protein n=1 Tax=Vitis vinifera TaxID=29760 RepID=D7TUB9_VITVI
MINLNHFIIVLNREMTFPSIPINAHMDIVDCTIVKLKADCSHLNWKVKIELILMDFLICSLEHCN